MADWKRYDKLRYADTARIAHFARTELGSSEELYEAIKRPLVSRTASTLGSHIMSTYHDRHPNWVDSHDSETTVQAGVRDTQDLLYPYLSKTGTRESALRFLNHEHTIRAISLVALRTEESLTNLIAQLEHAHVRVPRDEGLVFPFPVTAQQHGCPAAAVGESKEPSKEFVGLARLSGEVLIEALVHNGHIDP